MKIGAIGRKLGMTQIFDKSGTYISVTAIKIEDCIITNINKILSNGYNSIQLGCFSINNKKILKPIKQYFLKKQIKPLRYLKEFKTEEINNIKIGEKINIKQFFINERINIQGLTIGKGMCGNIKKNNFKRGPMTHGSKHHRLQGSLGAGTTPSRVFPGKKMSGHYGAEYSTIKFLKIVFLDIFNQIIFIKGSVPGKKGNILHIKHCIDYDI